MGRIILFVFLVLCTLNGCTVVSAVGGGMVDGALYLFKSEKESLLIPMRKVLVATQQTLEASRLQANLIEPVEDGYILEFSNHKLDGSIHLIRETPELTTVAARVHKGMGREKSVEKALFKGIRERAEKVSNHARFDFSAYHNIRSKPTVNAEKVGWYIPGSELHVFPTQEKGWLQVKMPSGKKAFLKGEIVQ